MMDICIFDFIITFGIAMFQRMTGAELDLSRARDFFNRLKLLSSDSMGFTKMPNVVGTLDKGAKRSSSGRPPQRQWLAPSEMVLDRLMRLGNIDGLCPPTECRSRLIRCGSRFLDIETGTYSSVTDLLIASAHQTLKMEGLSA
jgi:hypothetical protein